MTNKLLMKTLRYVMELREKPYLTQEQVDLVAAALEFEVYSRLMACTYDTLGQAVPDYIFVGHYNARKSFINLWKVYNENRT